MAKRKRSCKYGKTKAGPCRKSPKKRGGSKSCKYGVVKTGRRKGQCLKNKRRKAA